MPQLPTDIESQVQLALAEDIGSGDITAQLISETAVVSARIMSREQAILCGTAWVDTTFRLLDARVQLRWEAADGDAIADGQSVALLAGPARSILSGERTALNFLQTLSGTATASHYHAALVAHTGVQLLDTRKTIPGLRMAQKYAVRVGGCHNHRMGLFDAFLIKENHILACGGITRAIAAARALATGKKIEIEVQNLEELEQALQSQPDIVMLDNFALEDLRTAVALNHNRVKLEASGGIDEATLVNVAETGVDYISIGSLTKNCRATDFTLLVDQG